MTEICLELKNIKKSFTSDEDVLKGISLSIGRGEFITLLGASGCGKTTTLRIIAGLEMPDEGQVFLEGKDVTAALDKLEKIGKEYNVNFVISISLTKEQLPESMKESIIAEL